MDAAKELVGSVIRDVILKLSTELSEVTAKIGAVRNICPHHSLKKTHKSNTGNYDPSDDSYWTEFLCPDCEKFWTEEGSK